MRRKLSIRLKGYDYRKSGAYFVTICTYHQKCILGNITKDSVRLNEIGREIDECWQWIGNQYNYVEIDRYVIMPNHMHGILVIGRDSPRAADGNEISGIKPLGRLIGAFKMRSTKSINLIRGTKNPPIWQRGFYEHVIRNENKLHEIRQYIELNPLKWALGHDKYFSGLE